MDTTPCLLVEVEESLVTQNLKILKTSRTFFSDKYSSDRELSMD